ncbi:histidine ammonia-lyase [Clostridium aminobutyricum]|uniref:Histidine ammonia-lyase n=1 Tax=Clostridium aminobutyricum TaxID=33953 RepID=A0A939DAQ4_CLOAM|nr:histidine ammonia-lyase [Clostridium aminobutyricum]MBN7774514.1 histidine ammonia-lyase [Clostridium aminobutyricum]
MSIIINGMKLTVEEVIRVARNGEEVLIAPEAQEAVKKARAYVDKKLKEGAVIYGLTTGFGKFADTYISTEEAADLQRNLIISHTCAMGQALPKEVVRAAMLLRCNALSRGHSGIRPETLHTLLDMLNKGVHPIIPEKGSLGASGDLAPLSHMVLTMIGEGEAEYKGELLPSKEAMEKAGIPLVQLAAKEGLALINGTQIMTAIGINVLWDAMDLAKTADIVAAMTAEALNGITKAYDHKVHDVRGHQGQKESAANMLQILNGSENTKPVNPKKVQDPYSLRCIPQIHGASRDAIQYVYEAVSKEINAVTDNPIIFPDEDEVISGGNFHGQPMALAFDFLKMAVAEYANVSERRSERLINPQLSEGLEPFLTKHGGVCSGFMIAQYAAASMVSENKIYAHPACVDSIPSSGNQEDHVSMGTTAARTAALIIDNSQKVLGIELFAATQAIWLRGEKNLSPTTQAVYNFVRKTVDPIDQDVVMYNELVKFDEMVKQHKISDVAEKVCGKLR